DPLIFPRAADQDRSRRPRLPSTIRQPHAVDSRQTLDAVDVLDAFADQAITLANTPSMRQQSSHIDIIRLHSWSSPIHRHARGINDEVAHAMSFEQTMQLEYVIARLVARDDLHRSANSLANPRPNAFDQHQSPFQSQACNVCRLILSDNGVFTAQSKHLAALS